MKKFCEELAIQAWQELSSSNLVTAEKLGKAPEIRFTNLGDKFLLRQSGMILSCTTTASAFYAIVCWV